MTRIKLIVGLRNPGAQYQDTRHNAGEWFLDAIATSDSVSFKINKKFFCDIGEINNTLIARPNVFMNESGRVVANIARFYKINASEILIAHDELDLPPGQVKLKKGGGHGGHNGLRDIIQCLGTNDFYRLRIGIGHPGHKDKVTPYVLGKPMTEEKERILEAITRANVVLPQVLSGNMQKAMNDLH